MNTTIETLGHRLEFLLDGVNFRSDFEKALDSPEQLMAIGKHNLREYEKIEATGEEHEERIRNILSNILASLLQEKAIKKYGNTDRSSIKQVLNDWFDQPEDKAYWSRIRPTYIRALASCNFNEDQCRIVMKYIFDRLPQMIVETMEELIRPLCLLPRTHAHSTVMALVDIMKEEAYDANIIRNN